MKMSTSAMGIMMHIEPIIPPLEMGTFSLLNYDIQKSLNLFFYHCIDYSNPTINIPGVIR